VCSGNYLEALAAHAIDEEEREPTQQNASGAADVKRAGFRSLRTQPYSSIELASKTRRRGLIVLVVPPLCGLELNGNLRRCLTQLYKAKGPRQPETFRCKYRWLRGQDLDLIERVF